MIETTLELIPDGEPGTTFVRVYVVAPGGAPIATVEISDNADGLRRDDDLVVTVQRWRDVEVDVHVGRARDPYPEIAERAAEVLAR